MQTRQPGLWMKESASWCAVCLGLLERKITKSWKVSFLAGVAFIWQQQQNVLLFYTSVGYFFFLFLKTLTLCKIFWTGKHICIRWKSTCQYFSVQFAGPDFVSMWVFADFSTALLPPLTSERNISVHQLHGNYRNNSCQGRWHLNQQVLSQMWILTPRNILRYFSGTFRSLLDHFLKLNAILQVNKMHQSNVKLTYHLTTTICGVHLRWNFFCNSCKYTLQRLNLPKLQAVRALK